MLMIKDTSFEIARLDARSDHTRTIGVFYKASNSRAT